MSGYKDEQLRREEDATAAADYLVSIGRLEECQAHGLIFGGAAWDLEGDFFKQVMYDRNRGESGPVPWAAHISAREYTDLLKSAYEDHPGDHCAQCAKNMAD